MGDAIEYRRLRAPRDEGTLVDPPAAQIAARAAENRGQLSECQRSIAGSSLAELSAAARGEFLAAALTYTRAYRPVDSVLVRRAAGDGLGPLVYLAGHQPELFHAGVWFKNFLLARSAARDGAVAVNLVIDGDAMHTASLRVPAGSLEQPIFERVEFDAASDELPYEERPILDRARWESFGARLRERIAPFVDRPLIDELWPLACERAQHNFRLGECLAQARHQLEGRWGLESLELPHSQACRLPAYRRTTAWLLAEAPRLREAYNASLAEYRRVHRLRSAAHPAPDLTRDGDWIEAPFWVWQATAPRRRRLFARLCGARLELGDREGLEFRLPLSKDDGPRVAAEAGFAGEALEALEREGVKIRPRALLTTLLARLLLGDLFVHGIGGAKYDQVTDALMTRFLGVRPPAFVTATATVRLPIERDRATPDQAREIDRELRSLEYHPERYLEHESLAAAEKRRWIAIPPARDIARQRCQAIRAANAAMQELVAPRRARLVADREAVARRLAREAVLGSREFSFCLFPESALRRLIEWA